MAKTPPVDLGNAVTVMFGATDQKDTKTTREEVQAKVDELMKDLGLESSIARVEIKPILGVVRRT